MGLSAALACGRARASVRVVEPEARRRRIGAEWRPGHSRPEIRSGMAARAFRGRARRGVDRVRRVDGRRRVRPDRTRIAVPFVRNGWIQAAHTETALRAAENRDRQWQTRGADVRLLDAAGVAARTGARGYIGGWLDRRAGVINPLAYTLELARIAKAAGAASPSGRRRRRCGARPGLAVATASGGNRAKSVVVATNAYSDGLIPGLAQTIVPLHSFQIATAPLPADLAAKNPSRRPGGFRFPAHPRLLPQEPRRPAGARRPRPHGAAEERRRLGASAARDAAALSRAFRRRRSSGTGSVGSRMTPDHLPHIHEPEPGLVTAVGCQGRGVGLMTALGARLAAYLGEWRRERTCLFPFRRSGRSRSTPSARSALPRRSPGTACSMHWNAEAARRCSIEFSLTVSPM